MKRLTVDCDEDCGAFMNPRTLAEYRAAWRHWAEHSYLSGCAHAR